MTAPALHLTASSRLLVPCREYGDIDVPPNRLIRADGTLRITDEVLKHYVTGDFKDGRFRLRAKGVSGIFALTEDITVQVRPRFPLTNLTHMVSVCGYAPTALAAMREYKLTDDWQDWMLDVVTDSLLVAVRTMEELGLLRTYRRRTDSGSYPHGHIEMSVTINRFAARDVNHKAVYTWWEKTPDNPPNRCIKAAIQHLYRLNRTRLFSGDMRPRIARLGNALRLLEEVSDDPHRKCLEDPVVRGLTQLPEARLYYRPGLDLAVAVLRGQGFDLDATTGTIAAGSLLVRTEDLFEDFVRLSLQRALADHPELSVLDGNVLPGRRALFEDLAPEELKALPEHAMVQGGAHTATPDIIITRPDGSVPLVADAKYTRVTGNADRGEIEQVLLYGVRYTSPVVLTIHPRQKNTDGGLVVAGRIGDILVAHYRVDLAAADLDSEMNAMADSLTNLVAATS
ncbi:5-methylcytosine restriction system specificity protein McrC [Mycobacteroides chelonae]|uniref:5-methylcytosine restriction system specificity protein McrC n=1 Tax=Mycobacteroides chelonae TaxID=1774 RepID=UPI0039EB307C